MDMEHLKDALENLIDQRLIEHGLLEKKAGKGKGKPAEVEDDEITVEKLKEQLTALVEAKGKDDAKALLKKFKVEKLSDLPESKYEKFNAAITEAIGEAGDDLFG